MLGRLVFWATLILTVYALINAWFYRNWAMENLKEDAALQTDQLQTAMAGVLWNFDITLLDEVLDGAMKNKIIAIDPLRKLQAYALAVSRGDSTSSVDRCDYA